MPEVSFSQHNLHPHTDRRLTLEHFGIGVILFIGIGLRLWHINWGLPEIFEEAFPFRISSKFWNWTGTGADFNPHFFNYPALVFYIHFIVQAIHYGIGHLLGLYPDLQTFGNAITPSIIIERCITIIFDAGTILIVYRVARRFADYRAGLIASVLVAVNPLLIKQAHLINVDTPLTFFSVLAIFMFFKLYHEPSRKNYLLAGLSIGLAAASKYTGAYLLITLLFTHLLRADSFSQAIRSLKSSSLMLSLGTAVAVFLLTNPYIILNFQEFQNDIAFEQYHMSYGHLGVDSTQSSFSFYLLHILPANLGWIFLGIIIATAVVYLARTHRTGMILIAYPVTTFVIISVWAMRADRYILPTLPMLIIIGSAGLVQGWECLRSHVRKDILKDSAFLKIGIPIITVMVISIPLLKDVYSYHTALSNPDTRTIAKEWMASNLPKGSSYATGPFGIEFARGLYTSVEIPFSPTGSEGLAPFYDTRWYEDLDLLIASDYDYARFAQEPERFHNILTYYDSLRMRWTLVKEVKPTEHQNGPTLWFYKPPVSTKEIFDQNLFQHLSILAETTLVISFAEKLAFALFGKGKLIKSEQLLRVAVSLEPNNTRLLKELAYTLFQRNTFSEALPLVTHSLEINPNQPEVFALQGSLLLRLNRFDEAESSLLKALTMNDRLELPYQELELLYNHQGENQKLAAILSKHRLIVPDGSEAARQIEDQLRTLRSQ